MVGRDGEQPAAEGPGGVVVVEAAPCAQKGLVGGIFGIGAVPQHAGAQACHVVAKVAEEGTDGLDLAATHSLDERLHRRCVGVVGNALHSWRALGLCRPESLPAGLRAPARGVSPRNPSAAHDAARAMTYIGPPANVLRPSPAPFSLQAKKQQENRPRSAPAPSEGRAGRRGAE